jgi:hypothetical protein
MSQSNPIITGARAGITINGTLVGYATGVTITEGTALARLDTLGFIDTRELEPIGRAVSVSCNFVRMKFQTDDTTGTNTLLDTSVIASTNTEATDSDKVRTQKVLTSFPSVDITVFDAGTAGDETKPLYTVRGCRPSSMTVAVDRTSMMMANVTFDGLFLVTHQTSAQ